VVAGSLSGFVLALVDQLLNIELSIARRVAAFAVSLVIELVGVTRGKIVGPTVFEVSMDRPLGVIGRIFDTFDNTSLERLIVFGELLHALIRRIRYGREALAVTGLSCAIGADLPGIVP
jgi:hypothetical protein